MYNDFHSREGAPGAEPFYTLKQHEQRLEAKLRHLETVAEGTGVDPGAKGEGDDDSSEASKSKMVAAPAGDGGCGHAEASEGASRSEAQEGERGDIKVRKHLVLPRWEPQVSDELDLFDRNLAVKSLLPHLDQFDWPGAREIAAAQQGIPD